MKGVVYFELSQRNLCYKIRLERNVTVVADISATGKTTFCNMVKRYNAHNPGVTLNSDIDVLYLSERDWKDYIDRDNCVFVCDEYEEFTLSDEFSRAFYNSGSYLLLVGREPHPNLAYSLNSVMRMVNVEPGVNILEVLYNVGPNGILNYQENCELIVTEDSQSGYQFMKRYSMVECISAEGNANVDKLTPEDKPTIAFVDGAAYGAYIDKLLKLSKCMLYAPESFEWLLLKSGEFGDVEDILANPSSYIEAKEYRSWERFFTAKCVELGHYSKEHLPVKMDHGAIIKIINPMIREYLDSSRVPKVDWDKELERVKSFPIELIQRLNTREDVYAVLKDSRFKWLRDIPNSTIKFSKDGEELYNNLLRFKPD